MEWTARFRFALVALVLILLLAPLRIPLPTLSITLQSLVLFLAAGLLPLRSALSLISAYLLLGALGLPVFGGHTSGWEKLVGPTAGFLWGFWAVGAWVSYESHRKPLNFFTGMLLFFRAQLLLFLPGFLVLYWMLPELNLTATLVKLIPGLLLKSLLGGLALVYLLRLLPASITAAPQPE